MSLKKLAIFVEGYTESKFVLKLLQEFFNKNSISIIINEFSNRTECPIIKEIISSGDDTKFEILIFNSCTDNQVLSDLKERYTGLKDAGYTQFIGLRDLYPYKYNEKDELISINKEILRKENIDNTRFIFATMEVETWFIAECNHYLKVHDDLTSVNIKDNCIDLENIGSFEKDIEEPAKTLNKIYKLVDFAYLKTDKQTTRTIDNLDYENLYLNVRNKIPSLNKLFEVIEEFIQ